MPENVKPLDISSTPELLQIAAEVRRTNTPRLLKRGSEPLAKLVPIKPRKPRTRTTADHEAFLASAGGWKGIVDADRFLADNDESRRLSSRPPVEL